MHLPMLKRHSRNSPLSHAGLKVEQKQPLFVWTCFLLRSNALCLESLGNEICINIRVYG